MNHRTHINYSSLWNISNQVKQHVSQVERSKMINSQGVFDSIFISSQIIYDHPRIVDQDVNVLIHIFYITYELLNRLFLWEVERESLDEMIMLF